MQQVMKNIMVLIMLHIKRHTTYPHDHSSTKQRLLKVRVSNEEYYSMITTINRAEKEIAIWIKTVN